MVRVIARFSVSVPISPLDVVEESSHEVPTTFLVDT